MSRTVALVYVNSVVPLPPLSLGTLASYSLADPEIRSAADIRIFDIPQRRTDDQAVAAIEAIEPDLVGFSTYSWNYGRSKSIARRLKEAHPEMPVVFGGPHVSGHRRLTECLASLPFVDYIVDGEGEASFRDLLREFLRGTSQPEGYASIPGLALRLDGEPVRTPTRPRLQDLDEIPSPYLTDVLPPHVGPMLWETNRGCPYRCNYCYWGNGKSRLFRYSLERLEREVEWFAANNIHSLYIADANFGILERDKTIAEMLCAANDRHGRPIKFIAATWAKNSDERIVDVAGTFVDGGIGCSLTVAYQTLTPAAEELSRRSSLPLERGTAVTHQARKRGVLVYTDLIWGLPGESYEEFAAGLDRVVDTGIACVCIHMLEVLPGTEFYEQRETYGLELLRPDDHEYEIVRSHPRMTREDQRRGVRTILAHHLVHTAMTGHLVQRFLARATGLSHSALCEALVDYLGRPLSPEADGTEAMRSEMSEVLRLASERHGTFIDESIYALFTCFWDRPEVFERLMAGFYTSVLEREIGEGERLERLRDSLDEVLRFNLLVAPKPGWVPAGPYSFARDVGTYYREMFQERRGGEPPSTPPELEHNAATYAFENPWLTRPIPNYSGWIRTNDAVRCRFSRVDLGSSQRPGDHAAAQ